MELLQGHTLREKLKAGPLPVNLVLHYSLQIVEGLSAAHEKEIVHRDLKPENLFVTKDGRVKILDFGLAKRVERVAPGEETSAPTVEGGQTRAGMVMGTLGYMSPEQLLGKTSTTARTSFPSASCCTRWWAHRRRSGAIRPWRFPTRSSTSSRRS